MNTSCLASYEQWNHLSLINTELHPVQNLVWFHLPFTSRQLVPHGVFCSLVAFLRSPQNCSPWSLFPHPENATEPQCLTRNCIKFQLPKGAPGSLTLIDTFSHFEVHVNARRDICVHLCPSIWQTLAEGIQKAAETLKYQLDPKQAFLCQHENTQPHLALPAARGTTQLLDM